MVEKGVALYLNENLSIARKGIRPEGAEAGCQAAAGAALAKVESAGVATYSPALAGSTSALAFK